MILHQLYPTSQSVLLILKQKDLRSHIRDSEMVIFKYFWWCIHQPSVVLYTVTVEAISFPQHIVLPNRNPCSSSHFCHVNSNTKCHFDSLMIIKNKSFTLVAIKIYYFIWFTCFTRKNIRYYLRILLLYI
jgi:hypothetical protein